jgi:acyl-CoA hydrolase
MFKHRVVASFAMGSRALYDHVDHNPSVEFHPSDIVNDTAVIRDQHRMIAINSAIEIDLTGQVCADSMGEKIFSGIGGQMDFVRGAVLSPGGKAFIALPSSARGGTLSRIVPRLQPGAGVVTTRGHVQWVVTEHGAVNLRGRTLRERAELLISIADPAFRGELRAAAVGRRLL